MIWQIIILTGIITFAICFGTSCNCSTKPRQEYKPSALVIQSVCYNKIIGVTDRVGIKRHGLVVGSIGDDIIIGFHDNIAPIKDIEGVTKWHKDYYKSYCLVNKDVLYDKYKHSALHWLDIDVKWCFRNLNK